MAIYKKNCWQKNGSKTVEKNMAPYKNHTGENKLNQGKNAPYIKMTVAKKIGAKQLKIKNGTL